jgi:hypothetical protein
MTRALTAMDQERDVICMISPRRESKMALELLVVWWRAHFGYLPHLVHAHKPILDRYGRYNYKIGRSDTWILQKKKLDLTKLLASRSTQKHGKGLDTTWEMDSGRH